MIIETIKVDGDFYRSSQASTARTPLAMIKLSNVHCKVATHHTQILSRSHAPPQDRTPGKFRHASLTK